MTDGPSDFVGAKAALFYGSDVLTYLRDDKAGLDWSGQWDLPGGGRESGETGETCVLREIAEEFGLTLPVGRLTYRRLVPSMADPARAAWLFGGWLDRTDIAAIRFGGEGQRWELMPVHVFMAHTAAIPGMQQRVRLAWAALGNAAR